MEWSKKAIKLKLMRALCAIATICAQAFATHNVVKSWKHIGFEGGKAINKKQLLEHRAAELFKSTPAVESLNLTQPESSWLLPRPANWNKALDNTTNSCMACGRRLTADMAFCPKCGGQNPEYDSVVELLARTGKLPDGKNKRMERYRGWREATVMRSQRPGS